MSWQYFEQTYLVKFWSPVQAVIMAGILSYYYFGITGTFWAVTGGLPLGWSTSATRWRACRRVGLLNSFTGRYSAYPHRRNDDHQDVRRLFRGPATLWANNVKLRMPKSRIRIMQAVVGGIIAGFGARLAMGCNLAAFFTGIPPIFTACLVLCRRHRDWLLLRCKIHPCCHCSVFR